MMKLISGTTGKTITLQPGQSCSLGSGSASDLRIDDPKVSPIHSRVTFRGNFGFIESIDPSNQFLINQRASDRASLVNGDELRIGTNMISVRVQLDGGISPSRKSDDGTDSSAAQTPQVGHEITGQGKIAQTCESEQGSTQDSQYLGDAWEQVQTPIEFDSVGIDEISSDPFNEETPAQKHTFDDENEPKNEPVADPIVPSETNSSDEIGQTKQTIPPAFELQDTQKVFEHGKEFSNASKEPASQIVSRTTEDCTKPSKLVQEAKGVADVVADGVETVHAQKSSVQSSQEFDESQFVQQDVGKIDPSEKTDLFESIPVNKDRQLPVGDEPDNKSETDFDLNKPQEPATPSEPSLGNNKKILENAYRKDKDHPDRSSQEFIEGGDGFPEKAVELSDTESVNIPQLRIGLKRSDKLFHKLTGQEAMAAFQNDSHLGCFLVNSFGVTEMSWTEIEHRQCEHEGGFVVFVSELDSSSMQEVTIRLRLNRRFQFPVAAELFFRSPPGPVRRLFENVTGCCLFFENGQTVYFRNVDEVKGS